LKRILPAFAVCVIALSLAVVLSPRHEARAATLVFQADMCPGTITPPCTNSVTYGFVRFFFNDARTEADYTVDVKGLSNSLVTGADLYAGQLGRGTLVKHLADGGFIVAAGHMSFTPASWQAMAAGEWYVQVSSTLNPDGAMRGVIVLPPSFFSTIPSYNPSAPPSLPPPVALPPQPPVIIQGPPLLNTVPITTVNQSETGFTVFEDCVPGAIVRMRLQWATLNAGPQFVDLSLQNNDWQDGTYVGSQALAPSVSSLIWDGLVPSQWHYLRVNTQMPDGTWQQSTTIAFMTRGDCTR